MNEYILLRLNASHTNFATWMNLSVIISCRKIESVPSVLLKAAKLIEMCYFTYYFSPENMNTYSCSSKLDPWVCVHCVGHHFDCFTGVVWLLKCQRRPVFMNIYIVGSLFPQTDLFVSLPGYLSEKIIFLLRLHNSPGLSNVLYIMVNARKT